MVVGIAGRTPDPGKMKSLLAGSAEK